MSVFHEMIDLIAPDRRRWKFDRAAVARTWEKAFDDVSSEVLMQAARSFLRRQSGEPTVQKLQEEIDRIVGVEPEGAARRRLTHDYFRAKDDDAEMSTIRAELQKRGDPIKDWLRLRGLA